MKAAQFQRFLAHHSKKYGALANGSIYKQTKKGRSRFYIASDKFSLLELSEMHSDFKMFCNNHSIVASWNILISALRKAAVPSINCARICHKDYEKEFLIWIEKLSAALNLDGSLAIKDYKRFVEINRMSIELILPRALAAALLYNRESELSLDLFATEVMLSRPTLQKAIRVLETLQ